MGLPYPAHRVSITIVTTTTNPTIKYSLAVFRNNLPDKYCWVNPNPTYTIATKNSDPTVTPTGQNDIPQAMPAANAVITPLYNQTCRSIVDSVNCIDHNPAARSGPVATATNTALVMPGNLKDNTVSNRKKAVASVNKNPTACAARSNWMVRTAATVNIFVVSSKAYMPIQNKPEPKAQLHHCRGNKK